jgi:hypothetical protein
MVAIEGRLDNRSMNGKSAMSRVLLAIAPAFLAAPDRSGRAADTDRTAEHAPA